MPQDSHEIDCVLPFNGMENPLGKSSATPLVYSPDLLFPVSRSLSRQERFGEAPLPFVGRDIWNCYEFSWCDTSGRPHSGVLRLEFPSSSESIVESKSLKLYLAGFTFEQIGSREDLLATIRSDLARCTGTPSVEAHLLSPDDPHLIPTIPPGRGIDGAPLSTSPQCYSPRLLSSGDERCSEIVWSHLFRSLCPVTSQPDWATVIVRYDGGRIEDTSLLSYLISLRSHQGFHEACCELLFGDIWERCRPEQLSVLCCFTRRGGIDINPVRSSSLAYALPYNRLLRQ